MANKFKTLNNWVSQRVLDNLSKGNPRSVFHLLFNCGDLLEQEAFNRTCHIVVSWYGIEQMKGVIDNCSLTPDVKSFSHRVFVVTFEKLQEKLKNEIENGTEVAKQAEISD